jgi:hypothetical protein
MMDEHIHCVYNLTCEGKGEESCSFFTGTPEYLADKTCSQCISFYLCSQKGKKVYSAACNRFFPFGHSVIT